MSRQKAQYNKCAAFSIVKSILYTHFYNWLILWLYLSNEHWSVIANVNVVVSWEEFLANYDN